MNGKNVAVLLMLSTMAVGCSAPAIAQNQSPVSSSGHPARFEPGQASVEEEQRWRDIQGGRRAPQKQSPRRILANFVNKLPAEQGSQFLLRSSLSCISDQAVRQVFPKRMFYALHFGQNPLAGNLPSPLAANNIFIFSGDGTYAHVTDTEGLARQIKDEMQGESREQAGEAVLAWLFLSRELHQDGRFRFAEPQITALSEDVHGITVSGTVLPRPETGNVRSITAEISFSRHGQVFSVSDTLSARR